MITHKVKSNLSDALKYFMEHLNSGDYYDEQKSVEGEWVGLGAEQLGIQGKITEKDFVALCNGNDPKKGKFLTQLNLNKLKKNGEARKDSSGRRIFHDFCISCPKSVSMMACMGDTAIKDLHDKCVRVAMKDLEGYMQTRVRKGGANYDRYTKNMICGIFQHDTSRALDPHLHSHCLIFNATYDNVEGCWKAMQAKRIVKARSLANQIYFAELSKGLREMGYKLDFMKNKFEIKGISSDLIEKFSKRNIEINGQVGKYLEKGEIKTRNINKLKEQIQVDTRGEKKKVSTEELKKIWEFQLTNEDKKAIEKVITEKEIQAKSEVKEKATNCENHVKYAIEKIFEREASVDDVKLLEEALKHANGLDHYVTKKELTEEMAKRVLTSKNNNEIITTSEALIREGKIIEIIQSGIGQFDELSRNEVTNENLTDEQKEVINTILKSKDFVTIFRGKAGTGKSYTLLKMKEELKGKTLTLFAPQGKQVEALKEDGFEDVFVLASIESQSHSFKEGQVVVVDEAGQVSARVMQLLLEKAKEKNCRVILCGDTKQHGAVEATDAMELIEDYTNVTRSELKTIRRQDPDRAENLSEREYIKQYREAVTLASNGNVKASFKIIDSLGCIKKEIEFEKEYKENIEKAPLVVTQTRECRQFLNKFIRNMKKESGLIENEEKTLKTYNIRDFTIAEKKNFTSYEFNVNTKGEKQYKDALIFVRNYGKTQKHSICEILDVTKDTIQYKREDGSVSKIGFKHANFFHVAEICSSELAKGDRIVTKMNGTSENIEKICNGELLTVSGFKENGNVLAKNEKGEEKEFGKNRLILDYGYATTSYNSQGMTSEKIYLFDSGFSNASNIKQWYVSISRGRKDVRIFTNNKEELEENLSLSGRRISALETMGIKKKDIPQETNEKFKEWLESFAKTEQEQQLIQEALKISNSKIAKPETAEEKRERGFEKIICGNNSLQRKLIAKIEESYKEEMERFEKKYGAWQNETEKFTNKMAYTLGLKEKPKAPERPKSVYDYEKVEKLELGVNSEPMKELRTDVVKCLKMLTAEQKEKFKEELKFIMCCKDMLRVNPHNGAYVVAVKYSEQGGKEQKYWFSLAKEQEEVAFKSENRDIKELAKHRLEILRDKYNIQSNFIPTKEEIQQQKLQQEQSKGYSFRMR